MSNGIDATEGPRPAPRPRLAAILFALALAGVAGPASSAEPGTSRAAGACSAEDARGAEAAAASAKSWAELHTAFGRYARCNEGPVARAFGDTVVGLLTKAGGALHDLIALCAEDPAFQQFVTRHAGGFASRSAPWDALVNVRQGCPQHVGVCDDLEHALGQSGAARGARSSPGFRSLVRAARGVTWSPPFLIDVDGDGTPDTVALGRSGAQAVVAIARAAPEATAEVIRLPPATAPEGKGCGPPAAARAVVEAPPSAGDADAPPAAKAPGAPGAKPFRVELGDCDAFHFYFDGKRVTFWRR